MRLSIFRRQCSAPAPARSEPQGPEIFVVMPPTNDPSCLALLHRVPQAGADIHEINRWLSELGKMGVWPETSPGTSSAESAEEILRVRRERDRLRKQNKRRQKQEASAVRDRNAVTGNVTELRASSDLRPDAA